MQGLDGRFAAVQSPGARDYQEDEFGLLESAGAEQGYTAVLVVADGMGGHSHGDMASRLVTETFIDAFQSQPAALAPGERLQQALAAANARLAASVKEDPALEGMGSTLLALMHAADRVFWISVGDSPLWCHRAGVLTRLNQDHSMKPVLDELVQAGKLSEADAATDKRRHALRSALSGQPVELTDLQAEGVAVSADDLFILASDGVLTLGEDGITRVLAEQAQASLEAQAEALVAAVEAMGSPRQDNITVALYRPQPGLAHAEAPAAAPAAASLPQPGPADNAGSARGGCLLAAAGLVLASAIAALLWWLQ